MVQDRVIYCAAMSSVFIGWWAYEGHDPRSSENISAREVEAVIREISQIADVAAVPVHDVKRGEEVEIYVELREGITPSGFAGEAHCRAFSSASCPSSSRRDTSSSLRRFLAISSNKVLKRELMAGSDPLVGAYDIVEKRGR